MRKSVLVLVILLLIGCGEKEKDFKQGPVTKTVKSQVEIQKEIELEKQKLLDSIKEAERIARQNSPEVQERKNPLKYCKIEKTENNSNFWGTKSTIHVYVKITSKYTEYKDMEFRVKYLSKTGSLVGERKYTRFDFFQPNHSYKIGIDVPAAPPEATHYDVEIKSLLYSKQYK